MSSGKSEKTIEHDLASEKAHANVPVWLATSSQLSCHQLASALRRGGFFVSERDMMEIQIDADEVDFETVEQLVLTLADAVPDSELKPSADEMWRLFYIG